MTAPWKWEVWTSDGVSNFCLSGPSGVEVRADTMGPDASLIAAAPDLLTALKAVVQAREDGSLGQDGAKGFQLARAAIIKARGKS